MLKDVKKKNVFKNKKKRTQQKIGRKRKKMRSLHIFFNNTIDITLPSPNKARDA